MHRERASREFGGMTLEYVRGFVRRLHALVSATGLGEDDREVISIVSFPKSGRTWLRQMLCHYTHCSIDLKPGRPDRLPKKILPANTDLPGILFIHEDLPLHKPPDDLNRDKGSYRRKRVVFLTRDPRDIVVSAYFERTKRIHLYKSAGEAYEGPIDKFVYEEIGSLKSIV